MKRILKKLKECVKFFKIDYSFLCLLVLSIFLDMFKFYLWYILFIFLHEMSHLFVAWKLGYLPSRVRLSIFGASLEGFDDFLTVDELKIVLAGPLFNLIMVVVCYLSFWFYPESFEFLNDVLIVNQTILIFNILPIFPLDCGRVVLCFLSLKHGRNLAVKQTKKLSFCFIILMFILSVVVFFVSFNLTLGFACVNLCLICFESTNGTSFKREIVLRKKLCRLGRGIEQRTIYVDKNYDERLLLKFIDGDHYFVFIFVDDGFFEERRIDEFALLKKLGFVQ